MNREIIREYEESINNEVMQSRMKIGVIGIGHSVGCSFVSTAMAWILSRDRKKTVAFVQADLNGRSDIYDALCMDKRFAFRTFYDFFDAVDRGENIRGKSNMDECVNWAIISPETKHQPDIWEISNLVNNISCDIAVCDLGNIYTYAAKYKKQMSGDFLGHPKAMESAQNYRTEETIHFGYETKSKIYEKNAEQSGGDKANKKINRLINDMDCIIAVIDPMPAKLVENSHSINQLKLMETRGYKVIYVVNRYNPGVNKKDFQGFMKKRGMHYLPLISEENFYTAQYNCKIPITYTPIMEKTKKIMVEISKEAIKF